MSRAAYTEQGQSRKSPGSCQGSVRTGPLGLQAGLSGAAWSSGPLRFSPSSALTPGMQAHSHFPMEWLSLWERLSLHICSKKMGSIEEESSSDAGFGDSPGLFPWPRRPWLHKAPEHLLVRLNTPPICSPSRKRMTAFVETVRRRYSGKSLPWYQNGLLPSSRRTQSWGTATMKQMFPQDCEL